MSELFFVSENIIQRLHDGSFVAERRSKPTSTKLADRRDTVSPLAVTKRCIRYDPYVFYNRKNYIFQMIDALNGDEKKLVLVTGQQGTGKTSLVRGIVELMGGGPEQLLWFDINLHTDFDEITQFLSQYISYISSALSIEPLPEEQSPHGGDPYERLEKQLLRVANIPLLLVIDNIEFIVDPEYRIHSFSFKEFMNFLLSFPNIKMLLIGERLPYADMSVTNEIVSEIKLSTLNEIDGIKLLQASSGSENISQQTYLELYRRTSGMPWLLRALANLSKKSGAGFGEILEALNQTSGPPSEVIVRYIYERLTPEEQSIAQVLSVIRHPVDMKTMQAYTRLCMPGLSAKSFEGLDHSLLKIILRRLFPPQRVLEEIRHRLDGKKEVQPWYEFYRSVKKLIYQTLPEEERSRIHNLLQEYYMEEKNKPREVRIYRVKSKHLVNEATYHNGLVHKRKEQTEGSLESKSYLSKSIQPNPGEKLVTLDDYRNIRIPGITESSDQPFHLPVEDHDEPEVVLEGVELSDEERALLYGDTPNPVESKTIIVQKVTTVEQIITPASGEIIPHAEMIEVVPDTESAFQVSSSHQVTQPPDSQPIIEVTQTESPSSSGPENLEFSQSYNFSGDRREKEIQSMLAAAVASRNKPEMLKYLLVLARYRISLGNYRKAEECLEKAMGLKQESDYASLSELYCLLGCVYKEAYRYPQAVTILKQSLDGIKKGQAEDLRIGKTRETFWYGLLGLTYQGLADISSFKQKHQDAIEQYKKAMDFYGQSEDTEHQAEVMFKLAQTYDELRETEEAISYYQQSYILDKQNKNYPSCAATLANLGAIYVEKGNDALAIRYLSDSLKYDRLVENWEGVFKTLETLALTYVHQKEWQKVEEMFQEALKVAQQEKNNLWAASIFLKRGNVYARQKLWSQALESYQMAERTAGGDLSEKSLLLLKRKIEESRQHVHHKSADEG